MFQSGWSQVVDSKELRKSASRSINGKLEAKYRVTSCGVYLSDGFCCVMFFIVYRF